MTREEAIEYLKKADVTVYQEPKTKTAEALEMAIEALKADRCYLGSPCEYQNEDIKMPPQESTIDEKTKTNVLFSFYDLAEIEEYISGYIRLTEITSGRKVPSYVIEMYKYVDSKRKELLRKIKADEEGAEE